MPSETDAHGQEPTTEEPGAQQSRKEQPQVDAASSSDTGEESRSTGEPGQSAEANASAETPAGSSGPGEASAEPGSLAIDLTGEGYVPDAWSEYLGELQTWLRQHKEYPRRARFRRQEGTTFLQFVIDRDGRLRAYDIEKSSGHDLLDRAVIDMIQRAQPLPPIPNDLEQNRLVLTVPVEFVLR